MNLLAMLLIFAALFFVVLVALWVGIYIVLPIALLIAVISAAGSLIKVFLPSNTVKSVRMPHQKNKENQIIDVEYEEIK